MGVEEPARRLAALADALSPWALRVVATLRIPDRIAEGHDSAERLAEAVPVHPSALPALLSWMRERDLLVRGDDGALTLTETGALLTDAHPGGHRAELDLASAESLLEGAWAGLPHAIATGASGFAQLHGRTFWEQLDASPGQSRAFQEYLARWAARWAGGLAELPLWQRTGTVVDVGGGNGELALTLLRRHPHLTARIVELPAAAQEAAARIAADAEVRDRCAVHTGSFFDELPAGADVYVLAQVLHDWPDEEAVAILRRCAEAAGAEGRVLVAERLVDEGVSHAGMSLLMLNLFGAAERTRAAFEGLADRAGLEVEEVVAAPGSPLGALVLLPRAR